MSDCLEILRKYQQWRRGESDFTLDECGLNPKNIGEALDAAILEIEQSRATTPDRHINAVREKMRQRSLGGVGKYGTTLERNDLTTLDWLNHAQEEAMDQAGYLEVLISREEAKCLQNN